jgi:hypothetical protein
MLHVSACGAALVTVLSTALVTRTLRGHHSRADPVDGGRRGPARPDVEHLCRACGWELDRPGWVGGVPTNAICDCCAAESGVDDLTPERARRHRRRWIEHGAEWFDPVCRPAQWDLYDQLCELAAA